MQWNNRKKEYWEMDKHPIQIWMLNMKIKYRKWMLKTHGLGFIVILLIIALPLMLVFQLIGPYLVYSSHADQLKQVCKDKDFYYLNFNACESADARPVIQNAK